MGKTSDLILKALHSNVVVTLISYLDEFGVYELIFIIINNNAFIYNIHLSLAITLLCILFIILKQNCSC